MLPDATIVEILLAVLAAMVGLASFFGGSRANKSPAISPSQAEMDDVAADRAMKFYQASIEQLEAQIDRLNERLNCSDKNIDRLTDENKQLKQEIAECKAYGNRLEARLVKQEDDNNG